MNIMYKVFGVLFLLIVTISAQAQSDIVRQGIALLSAKKYNEANQYFDSLLRVNPKEVDALMMKGNLILNKHLMEHKTPDVVSPSDENILSDEAQTLANPPFIPLVKVVDSVEALWRKCLVLDPKRKDIHMGLATIFTMSLQIDKLTKQIPILNTEMSDGTANSAYRLIDYPRGLRERNRMDDANKVFALICSLYPKLYDLKSDWAGELLYNGNLKAAQAKALEVLNGDFDAQSRENITDIFVYANNIPSVILTYNKYSKIDTNYRYAPLVEGIIRFVGNDEVWKDFLSSKLQQPVFNEDTSALVQFSRFITSDEYYKGRYNDFLALLSVPTASLINWAVLNKAVNTFPDSLQFKVMLAEFYLNGKNYPLANNYFQQALQLPMQPAMRADIRFIYGFSLYKNKDFKQAIPLFQDQFNDENVFKQQASKYFVGKMTNDKILLKQLINSEQKSKYIRLADIQLSTIK